MKKVFIFYISFSIFYTVCCKAQLNLVPNASFENFNPCPNSFDQIGNASPWFQPLIDTAGNQQSSSDLYAFCCTDNGCRFLNNLTGSQMPRTGNAYAGIFFYENNGFNYGGEYIENKLTSSLINGKSYCVQFYISLGDNCKYAVRNIEAHFSNDSVLYTYHLPDIGLHLPAQIKNKDSVIVKDKINWQRISLSFKAQGGEQYITIGNFEYDSLAYTSYVGNGTFQYKYIYYYIDDVSVIELPNIDAGISDTICNSTAGVQLNASCTGCWAGLQYRWLSSPTLSDTTILNPMANPTQTTTYYFGLIDTTGEVGCIKDVVDSVTVYVGCVGVEELKKENEKLTIYPNPTANQFVISFDSKEKVDKIEVVIRNVTGKIISSSMLGCTNNQALYDKKLEEGVYFVSTKILSNNKTNTNKLVIIK